LSCTNGAFARAAPVPHNLLFDLTTTQSAPKCDDNGNKHVVMHINEAQ